MKILIIDNHDSFTYNLVQQVKEAGSVPVVKFCEEIVFSETDNFKKILISPGPGVPADELKNLIRHVSQKSSVLGICLGHQAAAEVFGGRLIPSSRIYHGEPVNTSVIKKDYFLFRSLPENFETGRYHSWVVDPASLPDELEITCVDPAGEIMGLCHKKLDVHSVQFHPESILTPLGKMIINNWINYTGG